MNFALHVPVCLNLHIKDNEFMFQNLHDVRLKLYDLKRLKGVFKI